jgi:hypothetical protein
MRPRAALLLLLTACAGQATSSPAPEPVPAASPQKPVPSDRPLEPAPPTTEPAPPAPVPATSPPAPASPPVLDILGKPRATIEARLGRPQTEQDGWHRYADVDLQYRNGRCTRLRRTAPATLDCADIPTWAGIINPVGHPLRRATTCEWPGISERHKLTDTLAASYDLATHRLEVWLRN